MIQFYDQIVKDVERLITDSNVDRVSDKFTVDILNMYVIKDYVTEMDEEDLYKLAEYYTELGEVNPSHWAYVFHIISIIQSNLTEMIASDIFISE